MVTTDYREHTVEANGLKLSYQEWGDPNAPPVLMLHGFGVSGHMFDEFAQRAQDRYRLIALDQRGHGDSEWSEPGDYSRDAFVADIAAVRTALGLDRFVLVGHSMGGLNAVSYVNQHAKHVRALILVDVGPESAKEGVDNIVRFTRGPDELEFEEFVELAHRFNKRRTIENIRERMRHRLKPSENGKWTWKFDKRFREPDSGLTIGSRLSNDETWALFRSIPVPTLLVRGGESDVLSQETADRAVSEIPRAILRVVPGAGHSVPGDNPDDFTFVVREFLKDLDAGSFEPANEPEAPSLEDLVDNHAASQRTAPGTLTLVAVGIGIAFAATSLVIMSTKARGAARKAEARRQAEADRKRRPGRTIDTDRAQLLATELMNELSAAGRSGLTRARTAMHDVDIDRAKDAASEVLHALGERGREAPAQARAIAGKARRASKRRSRTSMVPALVKTVMFVLPLVNASRSRGRRRGR